jgi:signal transduction histidine kinase/Flp pilus assembly protein TadD
MKLLTVLLLSSTLLFAQNQLSEILRKIQNLPDTTRIDRLTDYCWKNRSKTPQLALECGKEAARIAESISDYKRQAEAMNKIGVVYRNLADYDKAISVYAKALLLSEEIKDSIQIAFSLNNIGGIYRLEGNYEEALRYILEALGIFERNNHKEGISFCTINIGLIYRRQNSPQMALKYLNYTLKIREEISDVPGKALALNLIAEVYFEIGSIDEALKYYLQVEKEYTAIDDRKGLAATWGGIASVYLSKNKLAEAEVYTKRSLDLAQKISYFEGEVLNLNRLGKIYGKRGQTKSAINYFNRAYALAAKAREIQIKLECLKDQSDFYKSIGDYESALTYNSKYHALRDSILNYESVSLVSQMDKDFRRKREEQKYNTLLAEKSLIEKRRNYLIAISLLILVVAAVTFNRYRASKKYNKKLSELNAMKDKLFSIIAHDLKNPLHSLFGLNDYLFSNFTTIDEEERVSLIGKMDTAGKQILKLLENLLYWSRSQIGAIDFSPQMNNLYEMVEDTISVLSEIAQRKEISIENNISRNVAVYCDSEMIKTVLRNLISNSIKFTNRNGLIIINLSETKTRWKISVVDNGVGMDSTTVDSLFKIDSINTLRGTEDEKGTGLGLILCKDFIEKHNGTIEIESLLNEGTTITVIIPK